MKVPIKWVLDSSALVAYAKRETGADKVEPRLNGALMSTVNILEAMAVLQRANIPLDFIPHNLAAMRIESIPFDMQQARMAAALHATTRSHGLSYGDCACLALALAADATALTTDRTWLDANTGARVEVIR